MKKGKSRKTKILPWGDLKRFRGGAKAISRAVAPVDALPKIRLKLIAIHLSIIAVSALLVYSYSLSKPFVFVDSYITGPFAANIPEANFWTELFMQALVSPFSQPWLKASFAIDLSNFGVEVAWFRIVNLVLHVASCAYLYLLALRISRHFLPPATGDDAVEIFPYNVSLIAGVLFACHPFCSESVAYIAGRGGVLTGANILLALNLFLLAFWSERATPILIGYIGCFVFAVMALETSPDGAAAPMLLLAAALLLHRSSNGKGVFDERRVEIFILSALSIMVPFMAGLPFCCSFGNNFGSPPLAQSIYWASQFKGFLCYYFRCAAMPFGISIEPPFFLASGFSDPLAILGIVAYLSLVAIVFLKRKVKAIVFPIALIVCGYLPSILIYRFEYGADERFYIPLAGICLLLGLALAKLYKRSNSIAWTLVLTVVIALASLTVWRESAWASTLQVWQEADHLERTSHSWAMCTLYEIEGANSEQARNDALSLVRANANCQPALLALGKYQALRRNFLEAQTYFDSALQMCHKMRLSQFTYFQTAVMTLRNLIELDNYAFPLEDISVLIANYPGSPQVNFLAGRLALHQNKPELAVRYLDKAFSSDRRNPDFVLALAQACLDSENPKLIENAYKSTRYISRRVPSPELQILFGQAAIDVGRPDQCLAAQDRAIEVFDKLNYSIKPAWKAKCYYLKSVALLALGKTLESKAAKRDAERYDPQVSSHVKIKILAEGQGVRSSPGKE